MRTAINYFLAIFIVFVFMGCGSRPALLSDYQVYKQSMNPEKGQPNYAAAKAALEKIIYSTRSSDKMRHSATRLMALNLYSGEFGYYDEDGFVYWAKTLGSNKGSDLKYRLERIEKVREVYSKNKNKMDSLYLESVTHCEPHVLITPDLGADSSNLALYYLNGMECIYPKLINSAELSTAYSQHIALVGVRETKDLMVRGFELYAKNLSQSQFESLSTDDQSSLFMAKIQTFTYSADTKQPKFDRSAYKRMADVQKVYRYLQSDNDSDWNSAKALIDSITSDGNTSEVEKAKLFHFAAMSAYLKDRSNTFLYYNKQLKLLNFLRPKESMYMDRMTMLLYHKMKQYIEGNLFVDEQLVEVKKQISES